jgi:hypothetical protein
VDLADGVSNIIKANLYWKILPYKISQFDFPYTSPYFHLFTFLPGLGNYITLHITDITEISCAKMVCDPAHPSELDTKALNAMQCDKELFSMRMINHPASATKITVAKSTCTTIPKHVEHERMSYHVRTLFSNGAKQTLPPIAEATFPVPKLEAEISS